MWRTRSRLLENFKKGTDMDCPCVKALFAGNCITWQRRSLKNRNQWHTDPLDHPDIVRMSQRELADLPPLRNLNTEPEESNMVAPNRSNRHRNFDEIPVSGRKVFTLGSLEDLDYFDHQVVPLPKEVPPLQAWSHLTEDPQLWFKAAIKLRDAISKCFGAEVIGGFSGKMPENVSVGEKLDFFLVEHIDSERLVLTVRDIHLDVMTCIATTGSAVSVTSSVQVHNLFGKFYMLPVGLAHRIIVRSSLRRISMKLSARSG